jgi:LAO/AO transport system kinase
VADKSKDKKSALSVQKGIEQPSSFNPNAAQFFKKKKDQPSIIDYFNGIRSGNRTILSQAITLIESGLEKHQEIARQIIEQCIPFSGQSIRIGITGVPGVGKSTFIEAFGKHLTSKKHQLAVLAIDPSSERTKGSILGDKTRMEELATDKNAFIRPSPSAGSLGGVARKTKEIIILCEAAGFDTILVETVGVGQSETAVHSMVDFFLLLMLAGAGDELQGIKRGIMEMADAIVINKADGDNINKAKLAKQEYENALHLFPPTESGWIPKVNTCSARSNIGIEEVWGNIEEYRSLSIENGYFNKRRITQEKRILTEFIKNSLSDRFFQDDIIQQKLPVIYKSLEEGRVSSYSAAQELLEKYFKGINS